MTKQRNSSLIYKIGFNVFVVCLLCINAVTLKKDVSQMKLKLHDEILKLVPKDKMFYFRYNYEDRSSIIENMIIMHNTEGIALGSIDTLNPNDTDAVPFLWLHLSTTLRNWQVEPMRNSFLVITNLCEDKMYVYSAYAGSSKRFNYNKIRHSLQGSPPSSPDGLLPSEDMLDCKAIMKQQFPKTGTLALTMMEYDWVSNTVQINLVDSTGNTPEIPAIQESASRQIYKSYKTAAQHIMDSAVFSPSLKPPAIMQSGIVAVVPEKVAKKEYRWMIHGSIRVPVAPGAMVARSGTSGDSAETPFAIVTAMVVINKLDNKEPSWVTLKLPVLTPCKVGDLVDVSFSVDLKQFNGQFSDPGVYQVFIACGAFVAGPFALEVVE